MPADTSSAAAGVNARVGAAAAVCAALRSEPMAAKSVAADVIISGAAITYDMSTTYYYSANPGMQLPSGVRSTITRSSNHGIHADDAEDAERFPRISAPCRSATSW
jgi:hypothetical protein